MTKTNLLWKILVLCITMGGGISLIFTGCPTEAESDEDESGNEPKPGIYMEPGSIQFTGDEDHPFNLAAAFAWLKENALPDTHYRLILGEDDKTPGISMIPSNLNNKAGISITLEGIQEERTIQLVGTEASLFDISSGYTITLDKNITLKGVENSIKPLVSVNAGTLIMLEGSKITDHHTKIQDLAGGGVGLGDESTFIMRGGGVEYNSSLSAGGGVSIFGDNCTFTMEGGGITYNISGTNGGGVYVDGISNTFTMKKKEITNEDGSIKKITVGTIAHNNALNGGGGVYVNGDNKENVMVAIEDGIIEYNAGGGGNMTNQGGGGGINIYGKGNVIFTMQGGSIEHNNSASSGGGLQFYDVYATITGGSIEHNNSTSNGGGVCINGSTTSDAKSYSFKNVRIKNNLSKYTGGGIYINTLHQNRVVLLEAVTIADNTSGSGGGGIYTKNSARLKGVIIENNRAGSLHNNVNGGGLYLDRSSVILKAGTIIRNNTSTNSGGGVFVSESGFTMEPETSIENNTASYGGGLSLYDFFEPLTSVTMTGGTITGNTATLNGGGVYFSTNIPSFIKTGGIITGYGDDPAKGNKVFAINPDNPEQPARPAANKGHAIYMVDNNGMGGGDNQLFKKLEKTLKANRNFNTADPAAWTE